MRDAEVDFAGVARGTISRHFARQIVESSRLRAPRRAAPGARARQLLNQLIARCTPAESFSMASARSASFVARASVPHLADAGQSAAFASS